MDMNDSTRLVDSVERSELLGAIGKEIDRIDRLAASNGYTNWALWAATGVISWQALLLLNQSNIKQVAALFLIATLAVNGVRRAASIVFSSQAPGAMYFRSSSGFSQVAAARIALRLVVASVCLFALLNVPQPSRPVFWLTAAHFWLPLLTLPFFYWKSDLPMPDYPPIARSSRLLLSAISTALAGVAFFCAFELFGAMKPVSDVLVTTELKVALLALVATALVRQLIENLQLDERRELFHGLETDLTLSKIESGEAKQRFETLMLGRGVSAAFRPFFDAILAPLDDASAKLTEARHLLAKTKAAIAEEEDSLALAAIQRVNVLVEEASSAFAKATAAFQKLRGIVSFIFGKAGLDGSHMSSEVTQIQEAVTKVGDEQKRLREETSACAKSLKSRKAG